MEVSDVQPSNAWLPILIIELGMVMEVMAEQARNASSPILVTELGMVMEVKLEQSENAIETLGGKLTEVKDYVLTNGDNRRLFVIEKFSHTPTKYPRNPSMIKKKPL